MIAHDAHVALVPPTPATERYTEEYMDRLGKDFTWGWGHLQYCQVSRVRRTTALGLHNGAP